MKFRFLAPALVLSCGILSYGLARAADTATAAQQTQLEPIQTGEPHATKFAPLAYFSENCARCHGENGSFYGADFAKGLDDKALHNIVEEMADGPAQAPLSPTDLDAVTSWHRSMRDKKPFVVIVKSEKTDAGWQLQGEISPGATLQINGADVEVKGSNWTVCVAPNEAKAVKLRAQKGDAVTELDASVGAFAP